MTHFFCHGAAHIRFDAKPPAKIIAALKRNGFRWSPREQYWWRGKVEGAADLITWIDKQLHLRPGPMGSAGIADRRKGTFGNAARRLQCGATIVTRQTPSDRNPAGRLL